MHLKTYIKSRYNMIIAQTPDSEESICISQFSTLTVYQVNVMNRKTTNGIITNSILELKYISRLTEN